MNFYMPKGQRGCRMAALVAGALDHARDLALANLRLLGDAVRGGYPIGCSELTAALMRSEYSKLTDDLDAALVANNTLDVGRTWPASIRAASPTAHMSRCTPAPGITSRAICEPWAPGLDLIRTILELAVEFIDRGCSGTAGTFGLSRGNFRTFLRDNDIELGSAPVSGARDAGVHMAGPG